MGQIRPTTALRLLRPTPTRPFHHTAKLQAETSSRRRAVTVTTDTGRVPWNNLTVGEKTARTTQQTFNLGIILLGAAATAGVASVLYLEIFSPDSKTAIFNRAADRVRKDAKCQELLAGDGVHTKREIEAYGEPSWSRWARNRTIASTLEKDRAGAEHMKMHFYVRGPAAEGTVRVHMVRRPGESDFQYHLLALDVPGHSRYFLENSETLTGDGKLFGIKWR